MLSCHYDKRTYDNFDLCSGISFLPFSDHTYKQAPYQDITKKEYDGGYQLVKDQDGKENKMDLTCPPDLNWVDLEEFEKQDSTNGNRELACSADACEVVDIGVVQ